MRLHYRSQKFFLQLVQTTCCTPGQKPLPLMGSIVCPKVRMWVLSVPSTESREPYCCFHVFLKSNQFALRPVDEQNQPICIATLLLFAKK